MMEGEKDERDNRGEGGGERSEEQEGTDLPATRATLQIKLCDEVCERAVVDGAVVMVACGRENFVKHC